MSFKELFKGQRPIIGIQDCGCTMQFSTYEKIQHDIDIFMKHGVVPLVKNARGYVEDAKDALAYLDTEYHGSIYGISIPEHWNFAFQLAEDYPASFVLVDTIDIMPQLENGFEDRLVALRNEYPKVAVLGTMVYPRYSDLGFEGELIKMSKCCDALVYMGDREDCTMMNGKVDEIKSVLNDFPVLMGEDMAPDQCASCYLKGDGAVLYAWLKERRSILRDVNEPFVAEIADANRKYVS